MPNQYDFTGRSAVVTGGARGIGRAVVEQLIAGGASVAIWDWDKALTEATVAEVQSKAKVVPIGVDIGDETAVVAARDETLRHLGKVDILVNNAGINGVNAPLVDYPIDSWDSVIRVNLRGTFLCCRALVPGMVERNYGRIANVASIAGKEGNPNASAYSASKAGIIALTKSLGKELARYDIAVNCVTPAAAKTAIFDQMTQAHIDYMLSKIPRARFVEVDEIAALVAFCASADCSFTTGAVFDISGGRATY